MENQIVSFKPQQAIKPSPSLHARLPFFSCLWFLLLHLLDGGSAPPGDPDHLFICLSSQCFTCQWKVQASGRLLSLYFCILLINHSFHIMFRLQIRGETLTLRQILSYLTSTWTFSIQNSRVFFLLLILLFLLSFTEFSSAELTKHFFFMSLIWVSFCVLIKLNLLWKAISKQNRCYSFLSTAHFLFFKDQTIDLTDFFSPPNAQCEPQAAVSLFVLMVLQRRSLNLRPCGSLWNLYRKNWNKSVRVTDDFWWENVCNVLWMCCSFLQLNVSARRSSSGRV